MTNARFHDLFGGAPRKPEEWLNQRHMDLAASIQKATEEIVLRLARSAAKETGSANLCLAGGVALNCVANGKILRDGCFKNVWIQPAAGDAGGALGAALAAHYQFNGAPRQATGGGDEDERRQVVDAPMVRSQGAAEASRPGLPGGAATP